MSRTNEIVTENLKRWMAASKHLKTQVALARAAKVGQSYVSRILRGEGNPTVSILDSIAHAFRRKTVDLLTAPGAEHSAALPGLSFTAQEPPPDENELLQGYRAASPEVREIMLVAARGAAKKQHPAARRSPVALPSVPVIERRVVFSCACRALTTHLFVDTV
jgi:transcriptional regulator with XRE-family HTH domain